MFREQVFPATNVRYDLPSSYNDALGDLFFFTGYTTNGLAWTTPWYSWMPGWKYIVWGEFGPGLDTYINWINVVSTR